MDALLIQPRWGHISRFPSRPPLGLAYIAGALKKAGYDSHIVDMQVDDTDIDGLIASHAPRLVGFSVTTWTFKDTIEKAKHLKRRFPHIVLVAGGPHATALPEQMLDEGFDVIVKGYGAETIVELKKTHHVGHVCPAFAYFLSHLGLSKAKIVDEGRVA